MQAVIRQDDRTLVAVLGGDWELETQAPRFERLIDDARARGEPPQAVAFEAAALGRWDSSLLTFLLQGVSYCEARDLEFREEGLPDNIVRLLALARAVPEKTVDREAPEGSRLARLGAKGLSAYDAFLASVTFVGEVAASLTRLLVGRAHLRWRDFWVAVHRTARAPSRSSR